MKGSTALSRFNDHCHSSRALWASFFVVLAILLGAPEARAADDVVVLKPVPREAIEARLPTIHPPVDTALLGRLIREMHIEIDGVVDPPGVSVAALKVGDRLLGPGARQLIREALEGGKYGDARVVVEPASDGVRVRLLLTKRKVIDAVRVDFHGETIPKDELLRDIDLIEGGEIVEVEMAAYKARIERFLARRGFPSPEVDVRTEATDDPLRVNVRIDAAPGVPRKLQRIVFYSTRGTPDSFASASDKFAVKKGDRVDEAQLSLADTQLEADVRALGFHRATVSHDVVLFKGFVTLRVRVDPGARYAVRFEGNEHYDETALAGALELETEADRSPGHLTQKIGDFYRKRGYLDVEVELEQRGDEKGDTLVYVFRILEHRRVGVVSRAYTCLRENEIRDLSEGGPNSASALGNEIDSFLDDELPGADNFRSPNPKGLDRLVSDPSEVVAGARPVPVDLDPSRVYVADTYERAARHVQELYRSEGFLGALAGPVQVMRRRCSPKSPAGQCVPLPLPGKAPSICTYDSTNQPLPVETLDSSFTCTPDPARGVECEPQVWLAIPVKLGPRTTVYDLAFEGAHSLSEKALAEASGLTLGGALSMLKLEDARRKIIDAYKEEGYTYADLRYSVEQSPDRTRARIRFIIAEGEQVIVRRIIIRGNNFTNSWAIERRVALMVGKPYRASAVRNTQERVATLNTFASVSVDLEDPSLPQRNKSVIVTVIERPRQYTEVAPGFSTGEGARIAFEYGHRNLFGNAVSFTFRIQLAYLPTALIIDDTARANYSPLDPFARLGSRLTGSINFPEIGLGPLVRFALDGVSVHDLLRDFYLTKIAIIPNIHYKPFRDLTISLYQSFEFNNSRIFQSQNITEYLQANSDRPELARILLVPDGESLALAQRFVISWDRRDNAFNATRGTSVVSSVEHVDAYPQGVGSTNTRIESHFLRFVESFAGYVPLPKGFRIASLTKIGWNYQLTRSSSTYPDRLFFMGGGDSMRGWLFNSFVPQDDVDRIFQDSNKYIADPNNPGQLILDPTRFTENSRPIRGGNLMINERLELRIPLVGSLETALFTDIGNLWIDPTYPFDKGRIPLRAAAGSGIRLQTPVGPLALDYGINLTRHLPYEDFGAFNFAIGLF